MLSIKLTFFTILSKIYCMKKIFAFLLMFLTITPFMNAQTNNSATPKSLRHVVLLKFKDASTPAEIKKVEDAFRALPSKIKEISDFEWGTNNSPENINQGFTHSFLVSFKSEEDRAIYLPHAAHKAFVEVLMPHLDKVLVIDYWAEK